MKGFLVIWGNRPIGRTNCCTKTAISTTEEASFLKVPKAISITNLLQIICIVWINLANMVSNINYMLIINQNTILCICSIDVWQKQFNLFIIQSQNTQFSYYLVISVFIHNESLHKLLTLGGRIGCIQH